MLQDIDLEYVGSVLTSTHQMAATALTASGLTGATAATRYVGATASGAPASGTFAVGDFIIDQSGKIWVCTTAGTPGTWTQQGTVTGVTATDTSIVVSGTAAAPTIATGTLDVIATQHPPAANWSNNSHKITSVANGGAAQDAAAWGQTVSGILTTLGDLVYENSTPAPARLAGNTSATKNFLTQTGTGSVSAAPGWGTIAAGDLPTATTSTQGAVIIDGTASDIKPVSTAAAAGAKGQAADANHVHLGFFGGIFGTGADGSQTFDGSTTILGMVPSGSAYTMTRDIQCQNITINNGVTLKTANFRVFCQGTLTNNGTISNTGANASGSSAGAASTSGSFGAGRGGGGGGTGVSGAGASGNSANFGATAGAGGVGVSGSAGAAGTATVGTASAQNNVLVTPFAILSGTAGVANSSLPFTWGPGGGGGGSDSSSNAGGGGGAGGGIICICAWAVNNGSGTITATGGNGANGTAGSAGGGGGGSGGLVIAYTLSAWTAGTVTVTGGTKGTHSGSGSDGNNGGAGLSLNVVLA